MMELEKAATVCDPNRNFSQHHCHFDANELKREGCKNAISEYIYTNSLLIGVNTLLLVFIFFRWLLSHHSRIKVKSPISRTAMVQALNLPSNVNLRPSVTSSKETSSRNEKKQYVEEFSPSQVLKWFIPKPIFCKTVANLESQPLQENAAIPSLPSYL